MDVYPSAVGTSVSVSSSSAFSDSDDTFPLTKNPSKHNVHISTFIFLNAGMHAVMISSSSLNSKFDINDPLTLPFSVLAYCFIQL